MIRLNLGCGKKLRDGYVNVDREDYPGVRVYDIDRFGFPWADESVDEVYSHFFLEHVLDFAKLIWEVHRVLKHRGIFESIVPYGHDWDYDPFHLRLFTEHSVDVIIGTGNSCLDGARPWHLLERTVYVHSRGFPSWHLQKYLGMDFGLGWPRRRAMRFTLEKP